MVCMNDEAQQKVELVLADFDCLDIDIMHFKIATLEKRPN